MPKDEYLFNIVEETGKLTSAAVEAVVADLEINRYENLVKPEHYKEYARWEDFLSNIDGVYDHLPDYFKTANHTVEELVQISDAHPKMKDWIESNLMESMVKNAFGDEAREKYRTLIQKDEYKNISMLRYYLIRKNLLMKGLEQLNALIGNNEIGFAISAKGWPKIAADALKDLSQLSDGEISMHFQAIIAFLVNPARKDSEGKTPLYWAAYGDHLEVVKSLLDKGANVNKADNDNWTPLSWAAFNGDSEIVKALLDRGADVNKADRHGWVPLSWAACWGYLEVVKGLLDKGADVNQTNKDGKTPLSLAESSHKHEIVTLIKDHIAQQNILRANAATVAMLIRNHFARRNIRVAPDTQDENSAQNNNRNII